MKKYIVILLLTISTSAYSQISIGDENTREVITIQTDTMSVKESFVLLDKLCQGNMWLFDRKVMNQLHFISVNQVRLLSQI
jgi:hypothetical protein